MTVVVAVDSARRLSKKGGVREQWQRGPMLLLWGLCVLVNSLARWCMGHCAVLHVMRVLCKAARRAGSQDNTIPLTV